MIKTAIKQPDSMGHRSIGQSTGQKDLDLNVWPSTPVGITSVYQAPSPGWLKALPFPTKQRFSLFPGQSQRVPLNRVFRS